MREEMITEQTHPSSRHPSTMQIGMRKEANPKGQSMIQEQS
jgi:hypothetical protein